jgi:hypothetical protein
VPISRRATRGPRTGSAERSRPRPIRVSGSSRSSARRRSFRGCAFVTASAEAPEGGVVERAADQYRADIRTLFARLARELGARDPDALAAQLQVVYDGAGLAARMDRNPDVARASLATVEALIGSAL